MTASHRAAVTVGVLHIKLDKRTMPPRPHRLRMPCFRSLIDALCVDASTMVVLRF